MSIKNWSRRSPLCKQEFTPGLETILDKITDRFLWFCDCLKKLLIIFSVGRKEKTEQKLHEAPNDGVINAVAIRINKTRKISREKRLSVKKSAQPGQKTFQPSKAHSQACSERPVIDAEVSGDSVLRRKFSACQEQ